MKGFESAQLTIALGTVEFTACRQSDGMCVDNLKWKLEIFMDDTSIGGS